jgi:valyl-tRNA synthetase
VLPYITEEIWSWCLAEEHAGSGAFAARTIHRAPWPGAPDFRDIEAPIHAESFDVAVAALAAINKAKADASVSMAREVRALVMASAPQTRIVFEHVASDVLAAARVDVHTLESDDALEPGVIEVRTIEFASREA